MKELYKKILPIKYQSSINKFLRNQLLGDIKYLQFQRLFNCGALQRNIVESGLLFVHIPKSAGTSIVREVFNCTGVGHFPAKTIKSALPSYYKESYRFSVVRDPIDRAYSAFKFANTGGTRAVYYSGSRCKTYNFEKFVNEWLVGKQLNDLDYVFWKQVDFINSSEGHRLVPNIFDFKNLAELELVLSDKLSKNIKFPIINKAPDYGDLSISSNTTSILNELYKDDIELYNEVR